MHPSILTAKYDPDRTRYTVFIESSTLYESLHRNLLSLSIVLSSTFHPRMPEAVFISSSPGFVLPTRISSKYFASKRLTNAPMPFAGATSYRFDGQFISRAEYSKAVPVGTFPIVSKHDKLLIDVVPASFAFHCNVNCADSTHSCCWFTFRTK